MDNKDFKQLEQEKKMRQGVLMGALLEVPVVMALVYCLSQRWFHDNGLLIILSYLAVTAVIVYKTWGYLLLEDFKNNFKNK